jgi:hypothetical protein
MPYLPPDLRTLWSSDSARSEAPYVGIVGPLGSGKTRLLTALEAELMDTLGDPEQDVVVRVNLFNFPVADLDEMLAQLALRIYHDAARRSLGRMPLPRGDRVKTTGDELDRLFGRLLAHKAGRVTLMLDGLDRVPRGFARAISRRFHAYWEDRDRRNELNRLSIVVAGALSLLDLKREVDSAISLSHMVVLPWALGTEREEQVREALRARAWAVEDALVAELAKETGGEPAFLDPILHELASRAGAPGPAVVHEILNEIQRISSRLPVLESILFAFCSDREVRNVVESLCRNPSGFPAGPIAGIDRLQLTGCVVAESRHGETFYRFRNGIVQRFFCDLVAGGAARVSVERDSEWADVVAPPGFHAGPVFDSVILAGRIRGEAARASDLWSCLTSIREALKTLAGFSDSQLRIVVVGDEAMYSLNADDESVRAVSNTASSELARLVETVKQVRQPYIALESERRTIAVPLMGRRPAILIVELSRTSIGRGFSEAAFGPWSRWLESVRQILLHHALMELGVAAVDGKWTEKQTGPALQNEPSIEAHLEDAHHASLREAHWGDAERELDRWRIAVLTVATVLILILLYLAWPFVLNYVDHLNRFGVLISLLGSLAGMIGTLTFGSRLLRARDRYEMAALKKIYRRRLRWAHVNGILGDEPPPQAEHPTREKRDRRLSLLRRRPVSPS